MASAPLTIKLRITSWKQLAVIYKRDLTRSAVFLRSKKPPPLGTKVRINLTLPSETLIVLAGIVHRHIPAAGLGGRGPGVDIKLNHIPQSAMWLIESALASAKVESSTAAPANTTQAERQRRAPPTHISREAGSGTSNDDDVGESALEEGDALVDAEEELIAALARELESLRKLNPFQVLNIKYDSNDDQVRAAFGALTKKYHPDRFARFQSNDARMYASEIFILIRDAYRRLGDSASRSRVLNQLRAEAQQRRLEAGGTPPAPQRTPAPEPQRSPLANVFDGAAAANERSRPVEIDRDANPRPANYSSADALIDAGKYDEALAIYSIARRKTPDDPHLRAGIELAEGLKALAQRDRLEAAQRFETVLEIDPTNERAARELADMRRQATNDRKGLLSRLLGKKV